MRRLGTLAVVILAVTAPVAVGGALLYPAAAADRIDGETLTPDGPLGSAVRAIHVTPPDDCDLGLPYCCFGHGFRPAVLVEADRITIAVSFSNVLPVEIVRGGEEWDVLATELDALKRHELLLERTGVLIAAGERNGAVPYDDVIRAMEAADAAGFTAPKLVPPSILSWVPGVVAAYHEPPELHARRHAAFTK